MGDAREILFHVVGYCNQHKIENCFQCPAHSTIEKICYEEGFREIFKAESGRALYQLKDF